VVVGRPEDDVSNALGLSGTAFIFMRNAGVWSNGHLLQEPAGDVGQADDFGWSVGVSGDGLSAVVGAPDDDDRAANSGSAFVFGLEAFGRVTIIKDTVPDDPEDFALGFFGDGFAQVNFSLDDDADATLPNVREFFLLDPGQYFAFESIGASPGWTLSDRVCVDPDNGSSAVLGGLLAGIGVDIDLDAGEHITCTFTNSQAGAEEQAAIGGVVNVIDPVDPPSRVSSDGSGTIDSWLVLLGVLGLLIVSAGVLIRVRAR
jgi:hypothetical protein